MQRRMLLLSRCFHVKIHHAVVMGIVWTTVFANAANGGLVNGVTTSLMT
jgi:hypothetical protein